MAIDNGAGGITDIEKLLGTQRKSPFTNSGTDPGTTTTTTTTTAAGTEPAGTQTAGQTTQTGGTQTGGTQTGGTEPTGTDPASQKTGDTGATDDGNTDGEEYVLDEKGDLYDSTGKLVYTKDQFTLSDDGVITVIEDQTKEFDTEVKSVLSEYGLSDVTDTFDTSKDGLKKIVEAVITKVAPAHAVSMLQKQADALRLFNHLNQGGTVDTFFTPEKADYSQIQYPLDTDTSDAAKAIRVDALREDLLRSFGYYSANADKTAVRARVDSHISLLVDAGKVDSEAKLAYNNLKTQDAAAKADAVRQAEAAIAAEQKKVQETWEQVTRVLDSRKFAGLEITPEKATQFKDYITKVVKDGKTQEMLDRDEEPLEFDLLIAYLRQNTKNGTIPMRDVIDAFVASKAGVSGRKISNAKVVVRKTSAANTPKNGGNVVSSIPINSGRTIGIE